MATDAAAGEFGEIVKPPNWAILANRWRSQIKRFWVWLAQALMSMADTIFDEAESPVVLAKLTTIDETRAILKATAHPQHETQTRKVFDETV